MKIKTISLSDKKKEKLFDKMLYHYGVYSSFDSEEDETSSKVKSRMKKLLKIGLKNELTDKQRYCLINYYSGRKVGEIAEELGVRPTTVYKHIKKARTALKKCGAYL